MTTKNKKIEGMEDGTVYFGDCAKLMRKWIAWNKMDLLDCPSALADLIYFDPPWNTGYNHNVLFGAGKLDADGQTAQETAFTDIWEWGTPAQQRVEKICGDPMHQARQSILGMSHCLGECGMLAYLSYMAERIALMHGLLKGTGSIYLHCDPTASHYLKIVMDNIFGKQNFRNEIVWHYSAGHSPKKDFKRKHDIILRYTKSNKYRFNQPRMPYFFRTEAEKKREFKFHDEEGRLCRENRVRGNDGKMKRFYYDEGTPADTVWTYLREKKMNSLPSSGKERLGYKTQKTVALLDRIIKASSNPGDLVLDPFCGCGTSLEAASVLNRRFVGIDISLYAVETVTQERLLDIKVPIQIKGIPEDYEQAKKLAKEDPFAFEDWAIEACHPGVMGHKKGEQRGDGGVDGKGLLLHAPNPKKPAKRIVLAQVKAGKLTPEMVDAFANKIRENKNVVCGVFITYKDQWNNSPRMKATAARMGTFQYKGSSREYPVLQHWSAHQKFNKRFNRYPDLPELGHPESGKELAIKQKKFFR